MRLQNDFRGLQESSRRAIAVPSAIVAPTVDLALLAGRARVRRFASGIVATPVAQASVTEWDQAFDEYGYGHITLKVGSDVSAKDLNQMICGMMRQDPREIKFVMSSRDTEQLEVCLKWQTALVECGGESEIQFA